MEDGNFRRARWPEQKAQRRTAILAAGRALLDEGGLKAATLSAIGTRAGMVKSAVYRYFDTRELILLDILLEDFASALDDIGVALAVPGRDAAGVAKVVSRAFATRPHLCLLLCQMAAMLESNVPESALIVFKRGAIGEVERAVEYLRRALPDLSRHQAMRATQHLLVIVAGLWPRSNPRGAVARVLALPEFARLHTPFVETLQADFAIYLQGLLSEKGELAPFRPRAKLHEER